MLLCFLAVITGSKLKETDGPQVEQIDKKNDDILEFDQFMVKDKPPSQPGDTRNIVEDVHGIKINARQTLCRKSNSQINVVAHCPSLNYLVSFVKR